MRSIVRRTRYLLPVMLCLALVAVACAPSPTATPVPEPPTKAPVPTKEPTAPPTATPEPQPVELVIAIPEDVPSYDAHFSQGDHHTPAMIDMIYDHLVERDEDGKLVPALATSWEWLDDKTLELKLREGVKFHNGDAFSADDVKFSIERMIDPESNIPVAFAYSSIESVEIVDPLTVRIHLSQMDSQIVHHLTTFLGIVPGDYLKKVGPEEFARAPVGTGPYMLVEHVRDQYTKLAAFPDFYGDWKGPAIVQTVTFRFIPEVSTRIAELETGTVDIAVGIPDDKVTQIADMEGVHVENREGPNYYMLIFAFKEDAEAPFDDLRVRQALAYGADVQAILDTVAGGFGAPIAGPFTSITTGYDPALKPWPYDKPKAEELLAAAGYADGFDMTIDVPGSVSLNVVQAVAGQWKELGVNVALNPMELGAFNETLMAKQNNDMLAFAIQSEYEPGSFQFVWKCGAVISYYCNEDFETAFDEGQNELGDAARAESFRRAYQVLHDDLAAIYLFSDTAHWGVSDRVTRFVSYTSGAVCPSKVEKAP